VEVLNGVERIANPGEPLLTDSEGLVKEVWSFQGSDWIDPSRVHARSGSVTVVDPPANQVRRISASGEPLTTLGRPGGGPGEFLHLVDAFQAGNRMMVLDGGKGTVEYMDLAGDHLASKRLDGQPWSGFPLGPSALLVKGEFLSDPREASYGDWVRIEEDEDPTAFTVVPLESLSEEEGVQCSDLSAWGEGAARLRFTTPQIQVFDASGALEEEILVDLPVEKVSDQELETALGELRRDLAAHGMPPEFAQQNLTVMEDRWRVKCRFGPLRYDPTLGLGAFLEQNPRDFGSGNATLHFLSREGVYLARVSFSTPWEDFAMDDGMVYALAPDPVTEVSTLRAFRVALPEDLLLEATRALEEARR
jgi:hypothetical protein